ncbi:MAG: ribosome maturation factor RimP [Proteobacteria bacterium]|nr:ribosome maturation factor RimP [Pseudomonadota bacterium]
MRTNSISKGVADLIEPSLEEMGFELVEVEYLSYQGRWILRIYIDKEGGVTIDDCAQVSRELGDLIDVKDMIPHEYVLEISSPGLNRPLTKEKHLIDAVGKKIRVKMAKPVEGRRNFAGRLSDFRDETLYVETDRGMVVLPWPEVEKANLVYEFTR